MASHRRCRNPRAPLLASQLAIPLHPAGRPILLGLKTELERMTATLTLVKPKTPRAA